MLWVLDLYISLVLTESSGTVVSEGIEICLVGLKSIYFVLDGIRGAVV